MAAASLAALLLGSGFRVKEHKFSFYHIGYIGTNRCVDIHIEGLGLL